MRQGCPLSPLLFIIVLELMATELREAEGIEGITMKKGEGEDGEEEGKGEARGARDLTEREQPKQPTPSSAVIVTGSNKKTQKKIEYQCMRMTARLSYQGQT